MTATAPTRSRPQDRVEEELAHIRDLVVLRSIFSARGATADELQVCDAEIARHRIALARFATRASAAAA